MDGSSEGVLAEIDALWEVATLLGDAIHRASPDVLPAMLDDLRSGQHDAELGNLPRRAPAKERAHEWLEQLLSEPSPYRETVRRP